MMIIIIIIIVVILIKKNKQKTKITPTNLATQSYINTQVPVGTVRLRALICCVGRKTPSTTTNNNKTSLHQYEAFCLHMARLILVKCYFFDKLQFKKTQS